jgi:hypothetical protein
VLIARDVLCVNIRPLGISGHVGVFMIH